MNDTVATKTVVPPSADLLPLGTPILIPLESDLPAVTAIVVLRSAGNLSRYLVAWFDRRCWQVHRRWLDRTQFVVYGAVSPMEPSSGNREGQ